MYSECLSLNVSCNSGSLSLTMKSRAGSVHSEDDGHHGTERPTDDDDSDWDSWSDEEEVTDWHKLKTSLCIYKGRKEMFYLTTHSTHFIYGYMASDIWLRTIPIVRKETHCCHIGYSFRLTARVLLYAPSHWQDSTYHGLCYTNHGALVGTRNSSMGPPHEGSIWQPIAPWANALTTELHLAPYIQNACIYIYYYLIFCLFHSPPSTAPWLV